MQKVEITMIRMRNGEILRDHLGNEELLKQSIMQDIIKWIRKRGKAWIEHVSRINNTRLTENAKDLKPTAQLIIGRPPNRWRDCWTKSEEQEANHLPHERIIKRTGLSLRMLHSILTWNQTVGRHVRKCNWTFFSQKNRSNIYKNQQLNWSSDKLGKMAEKLHFITEMNSKAENMIPDWLESLMSLWNWKI